MPLPLLRAGLLTGVAAAALAAGTLMAPTPAAAGCSGDGSAYIGSVCFMAGLVGGTCPYGYLPADGRVMTINQNAALYAVLGTRYGGDGSTNFKLPDLRGRVAVGYGQGPGLTNINLAQVGGQQTSTTVLGANQIPPHVHPAAFAPTTGTVNANLAAVTGNLTVSSTLSANLPVSTAAATSAAPTLTNGQTAYLANAAAAAPSSLKGLYTTTTPASGASATLPVSGTVTSTPSGNPSIPAQTVPINGVVTGGTVTVNSNVTSNSPVSMNVQDPYVGLAACIATQGLFPSPP